MAQQVYFRNTLFSDFLNKMESGTQLGTPPAVMPGLYQTNARIASDSRNLIHAVTLYVVLVKANQFLLLDASKSGQGYLGLEGRLQVKDGSTVKLDWLECWFAQAPQPTVRDGFGGRLVENWPLTFIGETSPLIYP
jgi:hypothetical protein